MSSPSPTHIVDQMMAHDAFSQWLGIEVLEVAPGGCVLRMTVRPDMVNGFGVAHGGISFSFADSALAFASNSHGKHALSIETSISHVAPIQPGDVLIATAIELQNGTRLARYSVSVTHDQQTVALSHGTVFKKDTSWT